MKNFLRKKWFGPLILFLCVLVLSFFRTHQISSYIEEATPVIMQEASDFLPITIQNGEIVQPVDKVVSKTYSDKDFTAYVMLDTRTDTLDINALPGTGFYLSKKCLYLISSDESKVRCFDPAQTPQPWVITMDGVKSFLNSINKYMLIFFVTVFFVFSYLIILFYTSIMHWIVKLLYVTTFGQTLFVNTITYVGLTLLKTATSIQIGFVLTVAIYVCVNLLICSNSNEKKKKA